MRLSIKNTLSLLSLILILTVAGCASTKIDTVQLTQDKEIFVQTYDQLTVVSTTASLNPLVTQTGRYSSIKPVPTLSQRELLQVVISISFPDEIKNIREALAHLIKRSGYQLVYPKTSQTALANFFRKPLPSVHRHIGPMTLKDALSILTAPAFIMKEDHVSRTISYTLNNRYAKGLK